MIIRFWVVYGSNLVEWSDFPILFYFFLQVMIIMQFLYIGSPCFEQVCLIDSLKSLYGVICNIVIAFNYCIFVQL